MTSLSRELVFLILQFLEEEKFKESVHKWRCREIRAQALDKYLLIADYLMSPPFSIFGIVLEQESGFYFNMKYFEEIVHNGNWDEVEKYLSAFTKVEDNRYSMKIFFEIRKQKYLEALDKHDRARAVDILIKDLKIFAAFNEDLFKEITQLLTLDNFRENEQLSKYGDIKAARNIMLVELKKLIEANPIFREKLIFPTLKNSRLRTLINQSLNWQHQLCKNPRPNPDIRTLFVDHTCGGQPNNARAPSPVANPMIPGIPKPTGFPPLAHAPFQPGPASLSTSLAGWMANTSPVPHPSVSGGHMGLTSSMGASAAIIKHPRTAPTTNPIMDYQTGDSEHVLKRARPMTLPNDVNLPVSILPIGLQGHTQYVSDELPKNVLMTLSQGSAVTSMDYHPVHQTILLVGTNSGDIGLWELSSRERLALRNFKPWDQAAASMPLQTVLLKDGVVSVNRVTWSPDGSLCGVAYSKHIVHIYAYSGGEDLKHHLEIDAHVGGVNDLAFATPNRQLCAVTCGDDKTIKVWDTTTGSRQFTFEGHDAPVYSVCPHAKENIQFIFSTSIDGKIKAWLYDNVGSRVDYDAPNNSCTTMAYSADGTRLFSCGTSKEGDSHIVEWNESEGAVKREYHGLRKRSVGIVQFDTTKNKFLACGDEFLIKFWDMDRETILTTTDADGGLPASPRVRFNKEGSLLAVSTNDNGIKILANADGLRLIHSPETRSFGAPKIIPDAIKGGPFASVMGGAPLSDRSVSVAALGGLANNGDSRSLCDVKPRIADEVMEKSKMWRVHEISESPQCRTLRLPDSLPAVKVTRLMYTNSGAGLLALASNAVHKLWKWHRNEQNPTGKATASAPPTLWQPPSGILMTNEIGDTSPEDVVPCFALSKNDSYVLSASGGKVSLFNLMTFKTMTTFMSPPPAATCLAFHPQDNNVIAVGMDDCSISIYNVRVDETKIKLKGHQKRVTGLAFSTALNLLVSSGADAQLLVWSMDGWEKQASKYLQIPSSRSASSHAETRVQFHQDQIHLLTVHETQLVIYEAPRLELIKQYTCRDSVPITYSTYSCDGQKVYTAFGDGNISVFSSSSLRIRCRISPTAYLPANISSSVHPLVIAAHPTDVDQFAVGLSDGGVQVLEPLESEGKWGIQPPQENSGGPSIASNSAAASDQMARC